MQKKNDKSLSARERMEKLFDKDTFIEMFGYMETAESSISFPVKKTLGDGVIVGYGEIDGMTVFASSEDVTSQGGTLGKTHAQKICAALDMALAVGAPMVYINDGGGARIEEGVASLNGYAEIFKRQVKASGVILQLSMILGTCAGGACYGPALSDFIFTVENVSKMFLTGPKVIKAITNEKVDAEELGGSRILAEKSGISHFCSCNESDCFALVRTVIKMVLSKKKVKLEGGINGKGEAKLQIPTDSKKGYDMRSVLKGVCDRDSFIEIKERYAPNAIVGLGQLFGRTIGIIANQPLNKCGVLDCAASKKISQFVEFCGKFSLPLITFVDVPAFMPGKQEEYKGIIWDGSRIIYSYVNANIPKITVILRKAYGGAYIALNSLGLGADIVYAWPNAEVAVMGAAGAAEVLVSKYHSKELFIKKYENHYIRSDLAVRMGVVTDIIAPSDTRYRLGETIRVLEGKI